MKRSLVFAALLLIASLSSCQCAEDPDVGPIEDAPDSTQAVSFESSPHVHLA